MVFLVGKVEGGDHLYIFKFIFTYIVSHSVHLFSMLSHLAFCLYVYDLYWMDGQWGIQYSVLYSPLSNVGYNW